MVSRSFRPLLRLFYYSKSYRLQVSGAVSCSILNTISDLAPPYLIGIAIDVVVKPDSSLISQFGITNLTSQLAIASGLTLLIWSLESLTEYGYSRLWRNLAQTLQHELRVDAYSHLQNLELSYLEDRSTGMVLSILNDDINQLERFLNYGAHDILRFFTTILIVGSTFIALAPGVSGWAMAPIPFILWGAMVFQTRLEPRYVDVREKNGLVSRRLANNLSGMATIKSFTAEAYERDRVTAESNAYRRSNANAIALSAAFVPIIRIIILIGFTATLFLGGLAVANGRLSAGTYG
ncbi:MAG: ABC transporter ATP-binding protein, partial [Cyanobacteria bacterium P01_D01_bin.56]